MNNATTTDTGVAWAAYQTALEAFQANPTEETGKACVDTYSAWAHLFLASEFEINRLVQVVRFNVTKSLALHRETLKQRGPQCAAVA